MNNAVKVTSAEPDEQLMMLLFAAQRLQRVAVDLVTDQLAALEIDEINAVQALILCSVGDEVMTIGNLRRRGHYQGTNVGYNLRKLIEHKYIGPTKNEDDMRSTIVSLTEKGHDVRAQLMQRIGRLSEKSEKRFLFPELVQQIDLICKELNSLIRYTR
jgi:DNA-binding MarR family transcriptional regulator